MLGWASSAMATHSSSVRIRPAIGARSAVGCGTACGGGACARARSVGSKKQGGSEPAQVTGRRTRMLTETRPAKVGKWTEPALRVLRERYLAREGGEVVETPEEMCWRVALSIAAGEARYGRSQAAVREIATAFYEVMVDGGFLPNSPTLMNAGKGNGLQYSACYVLPVGDSMEEIFDSV